MPQPQSRSRLCLASVFLGATLPVMACSDTIAVRPAKDSGLPELVGILSPQAIVGKLPRWRTAHKQASPDPEMSKKLASVGHGADVGVYLGTWCTDSRREVPRLWRALEIAGENHFVVRYVGMDRQRHTPAGLPAGLELDFVPTIVVTRNGRELGRIVESAPRGIETELFALLSGERTGVISETVGR